jgi:two-component system chemotaxis response regulator CheB
MKYGIVVIGASLGGLRALKAILSALPGNLRLPLAIVQHRSADAGDELQFALQDGCALRVREASDKDAIEPGTVTLAPPNYHLLVEADHFALSTEAPVYYARPSIDVLFESAAEAMGSRVIGVVLTGTLSDGARGLAAIQRHGGLALIESAATAFAAGMPDAAARATVNATVLKLEEIGPYLIELALK